MHAVRVIVETSDATVEYVAHAVNRSKHALHGAVRNAWRRFPAAKSVAAEFTEHRCDACRCSHVVQPVRRTYRRAS